MESRAEVDPSTSGGIALDLLPGLSKPARRALHGAGYTSLEELATATESALSRLHGVGPKAIRSLREALAAQGKSFAEPPRG